MHGQTAGGKDNKKTKIVTSYKGQEIGESHDETFTQKSVSYIPKEM